MRPLTIVSNREWFTESIEDHAKRPCLSFVVLNDPLWNLTRATAVNQAGEPLHELDAAGVPVLAYSNGTRGAAKPGCVTFPQAPGVMGQKIPEMVRLYPVTQAA
jgi:hypothetical protein